MLADYMGTSRRPATESEDLRRLRPIPKSTLRTRVTELRQAVGHDPQVAFHAALGAEAVLLSDIVSESDADVDFFSRVMRDAVASSRRVSSHFELALEGSIVRAFRQSSCGSVNRDDNENVAQGYRVRYRRLMQQWVEFNDIRSDDRIAVAGGGPFLISGRECARMTGSEHCRAKLTGTTPVGLVQ